MNRTNELIKSLVQEALAADACYEDGDAESTKLLIGDLAAGITSLGLFPWEPYDGTPPDENLIRIPFDFTATNDKPSLVIPLNAPEGKRLVSLACDIRQENVDKIKPRQTPCMVVPRTGREPWKRRLWQLRTRSGGMFNVATDDTPDGIDFQGPSAFLQWTPGETTEVNRGLSVIAPQDSGMPLRARLGNEAVEGSDPPEPLKGEELSIGVRYVGDITMYLEDVE